MTGGGDRLSTRPALPVVREPARSPATSPVPSETWRRALDVVLADPELPRLVLQPVVDVARGVVAGYEVLSRFDGPPTSDPERWFAAAHEYGCGVELEARVLRRVLDEHRPRLLPGRFLTVNLSPRMLAEPVITDLLRSVDDLSGLVVELTEHVPFGDLDELSALLAPWRAQGLAIALDDAGSGYAGLRQLAVLRPDMVKLDHSLVHGVDRDPVTLALAELLGSFAGRLDAWLLAEGVERREELDVLAGLGVPLVQGFLLGRPAPVMAELGDSMTRHLRGMADARQGRDRVGRLLESVPTAPDVESARRVLRSAVGSTVVVVADAGVAREVVVREATGTSVRPVTLRVQVTETIADAVTRSVTRPYAARLDPMVCVDETGRMLGIVRLERAALALAARSVPAVPEEPL